MPRVRLLVGMNVAGESRERGDVCDVPADVASYLSGLGRVEVVRGEQPERPERATSREKATRRKREVT